MSSLDRRLAALAEAVELADGRLDPDAVAAARAVVDRAGARLGLGLETTVVALAGPTGAGKSTLFNALAGAPLTTAGVRRPTTSTVTAAVRGNVAPALLDWVGARTRHALPSPSAESDPVESDPGAAGREVAANAAVGSDPDGGGREVAANRSVESDPVESDPGGAGREVAANRGVGSDPGVVVLDLPDYDSVERAHRDEVDRVVELVDLLVWVVDPQKYADAALHDRYLRRLAGHGDVMVVVLNQVDRLQPEAVEACRADLRRLLEDDGLPKVPVLALSAATGAGLPELQKLLERRSKERAAAVRRLEADVTAVTEPLAAACDGKASGVGKAERAHLVSALAGAAGVPAVTRAVAGAHRRRGALKAGWPLGRWVRRLKPDPLKRLGLERPAVEHTSIPRATPVQRAQVSSAARTLAHATAHNLPDPWPSRVRSAATVNEEELPERLDRAVATADLRLREPRWWTLANLLQKLLALAAVAGALWLLALVALGYLQLEDAVPTPDFEGFPLPTLLLAGGLLAGIVLALLARWVNGIGAGRRARAADRRLRKQVEQAADELVLSPVQQELQARKALCDAVSRARSRR